MATNVQENNSFTLDEEQESLLRKHKRTQKIKKTVLLGANLMVVVVVLFKAGDQVPVMALVEVVGSAFRTSPEQIGFTGAKLGMTFGFTVIVKVLVVAH